MVDMFGPRGGDVIAGGVDRLLHRLALFGVFPTGLIDRKGGRRCDDLVGGRHAGIVGGRHGLLGTCGKRGNPGDQNDFMHCPSPPFGSTQVTVFEGRGESGARHCDRPYVQNASKADIVRSGIKWDKQPQ